MAVSVSVRISHHVLVLGKYLNLSEEAIRILNF